VAPPCHPAPENHAISTDHASGGRNRRAVVTAS